MAKEISEKTVFLSKQLGDLIKRENKTQKEAAKLISVSLSTMRRYVDPEKPDLPTIDKFILLCEGLGRSPCRPLDEATHDFEKRMVYLKGFVEGIVLEVESLEVSSLGPGKSFNTYWATIFHGQLLTKIHKQWKVRNGFKWLFGELEGRKLHYELIQFTLIFCHFWHHYLEFNTRIEYAEAAIRAAEIQKQQDDLVNELNLIICILKIDAIAWIEIQKGQYTKAHNILIEALNQLNEILQQRFSDSTPYYRLFSELRILALTFLSRCYLLEKEENAFDNAEKSLTEALKIEEETHTSPQIKHRYHMGWANYHHHWGRKLMDDDKECEQALESLEKAKYEYEKASEVLYNKEHATPERNDIFYLYQILLCVDLARLRSLLREKNEEDLAAAKRFQQNLKDSFAGEITELQQLYQNVAALSIAVAKGDLDVAKKLSYKITFPRILENNWLAFEVEKIRSEL